MEKRARTVVAETLTKLPKGTRIDALVAFNDEMAFGARQAFDSVYVRRPAPLFLGVDALPGPDGGIDKVDRNIISASFIYPAGAKELLGIVSQILHGNPFEKTLYLKTAIIDKTNVSVVKLQREQIEERQAMVDRLNQLLNEQLFRYTGQRQLMALIMVVAILILMATVFLAMALRISIRSRRKLSQKNRDLKEMTRELEETNLAKLTFFTNISHEFKTPLSLISGPLEPLLLSGSFHGEEKEALQMIQRNTGRLQALIGEILDFRSYENGKLKAVPSPVDLETFLKEVGSLFSDIIIRRQIRFSFDAAPFSYRMLLDADKVEKIYFNLLSNAFKFVDEGGEIRVRMHPLNGDDRIEITVFNSGSFIPEAMRKDIFHRFYKVNSPENQSGTGIGLTLVSALVDVLEGDISVESEEGVGTTFFVRLPWIPAAEDAGEARTAGAYAKGMIQQFASPYEDYSQVDEVEDNDRAKVLVIEDNADMRRHLRHILKDEYRVYLAGDGEEGLRKAVQFLPQVIVCDILMPGLNGYEVCDALRKNVRTRDIPVLLLSACSIDEQIARGYESGADAYIRKPFSVHVLKARIRNLIEKQRRNVSPTGVDWLVDNAHPVTEGQEVFLNDIKKFIDEHLADDISAPMLIDAMGMSKSAFYRRLRDITEYSLTDIICLIRIKKALNLILFENKNISEAALDTGFSSLSYFSRVFSKYYKESPSDFIRRTTVN